MDWQPIETAPKDGTPILAYGQGTDDIVWGVGEPMPPMMATVRWREIEYDDYEDLPDGLARKVRRKLEGHWQPFSRGFFKPTHWMPLPAPPA